MSSEQQVQCSDLRGAAQDYKRKHINNISTNTAIRVLTQS